MGVESGEKVVLSFLCGRIIFNVLGVISPNEVKSWDLCLLATIGGQ